MASFPHYNSIVYTPPIASAITWEPEHANMRMLNSDLAQGPLAPYGE